MSSHPISIIEALGAAPTAAAQTGATAPSGPYSSGTSFSRMIWDGIDQINKRANDADAMVTAFALDDSVPPHQVMFALAQAQHSLGVMLQVRSRLVESYQELMRMQL